jgi:hypothetical protein
MRKSQGVSRWGAKISKMAPAPVPVGRKHVFLSSAAACSASEYRVSSFFPLSILFFLWLWEFIFSLLALSHKVYVQYSRYLEYTVKTRWSRKLSSSGVVQIARNLALSVAKNGREKNYTLAIIGLSSIWGNAFSAILYPLARNITLSVKLSIKAA